MIYLDTNVIIDILDDQSARQASCQELLTEALAQGPVFICDSVYSEASIGMEKIEHLDEILRNFNIIKRHPTNESLFAAGRAFKQYRDIEAGPKNNVLPDFFIGAQAFCDGAKLITSDAKRMTHYFAELEVITPIAA